MAAKCLVAIAIMQLMRRKTNIFQETGRVRCLLRRRQARRRRLQRFMRHQQQQLNMFVMFMLTQATIHFGIRDRDMWVRYNRGREFWQNTVNRVFLDTDWLENFRMSKASFDMLCDMLRPRLQRQQTNMRLPLTVELQLAITLWVLGSNADYRTVGHLMGVARLTVCITVHRTCDAISALRNVVIKFPSGAELQRTVLDYKQKWGFPNCAGAIDGCHIPILAPHDNHADYYNRKGWYSIVLQGCVNDCYEFTNIYVGWPGRVHDARVLTHSAIFDKGESGTLFDAPTTEYEGNILPVVLLGDPAYPLRSWLLKPYIDNGQLTLAQQHFNYRLSRARMTVENTLGRLKGRWRCLLKRLDMDTAKVPTVITACCVLHNICERAHDVFRSEWLDEVEAGNQNFPQPLRDNGQNNDGNMNGTQLRQRLTDRLLE